MSYLQINNLTIENKITKEILLNNINLTIDKNKILGIIGESGSGKSLLCKTLLGILPSNLKVKGSIKLNNIELLENSKIIKNSFSIILQEAMNAFNPLYKIRSHMLESIQIALSKDKKIELCKKNLKKVGLNDTEKILSSYAHELSGGQLQRVMIAIALVQNKHIIVADEPTSSLDTINQKEIIEIFKKLKKTIIFVSHDLALISYLTDDVIILKEGEIKEKSTKNNIFYKPKNSYTKFLLKTQKNLSEGFISCLK